MDGRDAQRPGPISVVLIAVAGWMNQRQLEVIDCLREENRVLREQLGQRRLRLNDDQRRRLAAICLYGCFSRPQAVVYWGCRGRPFRKP